MSVSLTTCNCKGDEITPVTVRSTVDQTDRNCYNVSNFMVLVMAKTDWLHFHYPKRTRKAKVEALDKPPVVDSVYQEWYAKQLPQRVQEWNDLRLRK